MKKFYSTFIAFFAMTAMCVAQNVWGVKLEDVGSDKIEVVKVVKEELGMTLKGAKDLVDLAPVVLVENIAKERAETFAQNLRGAGATAELLVKINSKTFPDEEFQDFVFQNFNTDKDLYLSETEIAAVTEIDLQFSGIASLKGIEYFTALERLDCSMNNITELDVSGCTALETLDCSYCKITKLDVTGCDALKSLNCNVNKLNGDAITALVSSLSDRNGKKNGELYAYDPSDLDEENLITKDQVAIATSKNWTVYAYNATSRRNEEYAGLDPVPDSFVRIIAANFPDDDFRSFVKTTFDTDKDGFLSETEIAAVTKIDVMSKHIVTLKGIEYFTALEILKCSENDITELDLSKNIKLRELDCSQSKLTALNLSGCAALETLDCSFNKLSALDFTGCASLKKVDCQMNKIESAAMVALVSSLSNRSGKEKGAFCVCYPSSPTEKNVCTTEHVAAAKSKNWTVYAFDSDSWGYEEYAGLEPMPAVGLEISAANFPDYNFYYYIVHNYDKDNNSFLSEAEIIAAKTMNVANSDIKTLKGIEHFVALEYLDCSDNQLIALDVTGLAKLKEVRCQGNKLCDKEMTTLVTSLSNRTATDAGKLYVLDSSKSSEENVIEKGQVAIAKGKNWKVYACTSDSGLFGEYAGSDPLPAGYVKISTKNFPDDDFRAFVTKNYDTNTDGYLSKEERNAVKEMDVSDNIFHYIETLKGIEFFTALEYLDCSNNIITSLDVTGLAKLKVLNCAENNCTMLNVSGCTALEKLMCNYNRLTALDISECTALQSLNCFDNRLTTLDVSACPSLRKINCEMNNISGEAMTALLNSLCDRNGKTAGSICLFELSNSFEQNVCTTAQVAIATGKNWYVLAYNATLDETEDYAGSELTAIRTVETTARTAANDSWYSIDGKKLSGEPTRPGIYIHGGRKVIK